MWGLCTDLGEVTHSLLVSHGPRTERRNCPRRGRASTPCPAAVDRDSRHGSRHGLSGRLEEGSSEPCMGQRSSSPRTSMAPSRLRASHPTPTATDRTLPWSTGSTGTSRFRCRREVATPPAPALKIRGQPQRAQARRRPHAASAHRCDLAGPPPSRAPTSVRAQSVSLRVDFVPQTGEGSDRRRVIRYLNPRRPLLKLCPTYVAGR